MFAGSTATMAIVTGLFYLVIRGGGHPDRQLGKVVILSSILFLFSLVAVYMLTRTGS